MIRQHVAQYVSLTSLIREPIRPSQLDIRQASSGLTCFTVQLHQKIESSLARGVSLSGARRLEELNFGCPASDQPWKYFPTALVPLRQLLSGYGVWILPGIEPPDERRGSNISTTNIKCPACQSSPLVIVKFDIVVNVAVQATRERLHTKRCLAKYANIIQQYLT